MTTKQGVILFAHGARSPSWALPFERLADGLQSAEKPVQLAFLEFMSPDFGAAVDALAAQGCTTIQVLPCFLAGGGHVLRDLPALQEAAAAKHPQMQWQLFAALGDHPVFQAALLRSCQILLDEAHA
jgi:sirohydrochlorin cobaltochelatase